MNGLKTFLKGKKQREIVILSCLVLLALASIIIANSLAKRIQAQEEAQVILWAKAITEKAKILKLSNEVFSQLANEERKKVEITAKATQLIVSENKEDVLSIFLDIIKMNDQIPIISTDEQYTVIDFKNIDPKTIQKGIKLTKDKHPEFFNYPPVKIHFLNKKNYIFYRESIIFQKIQQVLQQSSNQFIDEITNNSSLLPILLFDQDKHLLNYGNIPEEITSDSLKFKAYIDDLTSSSEPISLDIDAKNKKYLYYQSANLASYIKWFPIGLYTVLGIIFFLAYSAIRNTRKFEKNQIWVGMSKETAHQLGTPISSLSAWLEVFGENEQVSAQQQNVLAEMKKDVNRLSLIADRFSKIGSKPKLESVNLQEILTQCYDYLKKRGSKKIDFTLHAVDSSMNVEINRQLFEWVIENLVKNAYDAIPNEGKIDIRTTKNQNKIFIDIQDTGKGILPKDVEQIFEPGFTTKKRGWGLGLSLCKRIIEDYFNGKIYVLDSKLNRGSTIRIELGFALR